MNNRKSLRSFLSLLSLLCCNSRNSRNSMNPKNLSFLAICSLLILVWAGYTYAQGELKETVPDLCYKCHIKLKESLSRGDVHFPFKDGKCMACHDAHTSDMKGLVK